MSDEVPATYRVVFWGETDLLRSRREVALKFARRARIRSVKQLRYLFSGRLLTLKRGLSEAQARLFSEQLMDLGLVCRLEREVAWQPADLPEDRPRHTASIHFDLSGLMSPLEFRDDDNSPPPDGEADVARNPFGARDLPEFRHPPVRYYDGRPVR